MISLLAHSYATLLVLAVSGGVSAPTTPREAAARLAKAAAAPALSSPKGEPQASHELGDFGSLSLGEPNRGRLLNGVRLRSGPLFELVTPDFSWGTEETVASLTRATELVHRRHPGTTPLHVGHISGREGGRLRPHLSHQSGRDVDLGFFYVDKRVWYRRATPQNLDLPRTWTLVRALITETDVEIILLDRSLHQSLRAEAERRGENAAWLHSLFHGVSDLPPLIRHARGHTTHLHVRFFSPEAQTNAQRAYPILLAKKLVEPAVAYNYYLARNGDTLGRIAHRFGVSVQELQKANNLRGTVIQARRTYRIPKEGTPAPRAEIKCPPRRLPEKFSQTKPAALPVASPAAGLLPSFE